MPLPTDQATSRFRPATPKGSRLTEQIGLGAEVWRNLAEGSVDADIDALRNEWDRRAAPREDSSESPSPVVVRLVKTP